MQFSFIFQYEYKLELTKSLKKFTRFIISMR